MKILLNTNIVLDLLMDRLPFADAGAEVIITRNQKDFKKSRILVYSSEEFARIPGVCRI